MIDRRSVLKSIAISGLSKLRFTNLGFESHQRKTMPRKETKIFDPADGYGPLTDPLSITDCTVTKRGNRWWMYMGSRVRAKPSIYLFSASLPEGAPLAATG